jgi:sugar/nucleoside kinase (ribokinase family)
VKRRAAGAELNALDLLVIGDCNPDVLALGIDVTPDFGQREKLVDSIALVVGGSAAITAVAAARLGLRVVLAAAIGADAAGEFMLGRLAAEGVDTAAVVARPGAATGMSVALTRGGDRAILTATGAMTTLAADEVPRSLLAQVRHVHVSSYFLLEQSLGPGLAELLAAAHGCGATTSLDTNWDPGGRWGGDQLRRVLAHSDMLMPNGEEAKHLSGQTAVCDALPALSALGPTVVVKLGARGAVFMDGPQPRLIRPPSGAAGEFVDATGAGDCFNAGLIAGLLGGMQLPAAIRLGCATGLASTRGLGGTETAPDLAAALDLARRSGAEAENGLLDVTLARRRERGLRPDDREA